MVDRALRQLAPTNLTNTLRPVDAYVKAYYMPWDELARWGPQGQPLPSASTYLPSCWPEPCTLTLSPDLLA